MLGYEEEGSTEGRFSKKGQPLGYRRDFRALRASDQQFAPAASAPETLFDATVPRHFSGLWRPIPEGPFTFGFLAFFLVMKSEVFAGQCSWAQDLCASENDEGHMPSWRRTGTFGASQEIGSFRRRHPRQKIRSTPRCRATFRDCGGRSQEDRLLSGFWRFVW